MTLIFFHIEKSGGTSLQYLFRQIYGDKFYQYHINHEEKCREELQQMHIKPLVVHGHMTYGVHEVLDKGYQYLTVLRDPYERYLSHYYHIKTREKEGVAFSIEDFMETCPQCHNLLVRRLVGKVFNPITEQDVEMAFQRLSLFKHIGFMDNFRGFAQNLIGTYCWGECHLEQKNGSGCLKEFTKFDAPLIKKIYETNIYDVQLYHKIRGRNWDSIVN